MPITGSQPAYSTAQGGVMRGGSSRGNVTTPFVFIAIDGIHYAKGRATPTQKVRTDTLSIFEREGETPNTAEFETLGFVPENLQDVVMTMGSKNNLDRLFGGVILTDATAYTGIPSNNNDAVTCVDYGWHLTRRTITKRWTNESATVIAREIIAQVPGFTSRWVEEGLPVLDEFTVTNQTAAKALGNLCERIGGYYKPTYHKDVRFGITTDTSMTNPTDLTSASALTELNDFVVTRDTSQRITRQPVEGGGSTALARVDPGETILPVAEAHWYNPLGGMVRSGPQVIDYTGVQLGGAGSLVGPSVTPVVKPATALFEGGSLTAGAHQWAYTWVTASGETLPSPLSVVQTARSYTPPTPGVAPSAYPVPAVDAHATYNYHAGTSGLTIGASYTYRLAFITGGGTGVSELGPESAAVTAVASLNNPAIPSQIIITFDVPGNTHPADGNPIRQVMVYRIENGSGVTELTGWVTLGEHDVYLTTMIAFDFGGGEGSEYGAGGLYGPASAASFFSVDLYAIALGPAGTTQRKIYQTAAGGLQLKLQQTIANNTAYTATASGADGSLGANAPTTDTSGLSTAAGRVNAGSTSILTPSAGPFSATGGWALSGQQVIRYTGISGNTLTGVPASGNGAILSPLNYGDALDPAPALTGIAVTLPDGVTLAALESISGLEDLVLFTMSGPHGVAIGAVTSVVVSGANEEVFNRTWIVTATDVDLFQTLTLGTGALTATGPFALTTVGTILYAIHVGDQVNLRVVIDDISAQAEVAARLGGTDDGIIEGDCIVDGRISEIEAIARGTAALAFRSEPGIALNYTTRDKNSHAQRTVGANLGAPQNVAGSFKLLGATITDFTPARWPVFTVEASNRRFTMLDLLRNPRGR